MYREHTCSYWPNGYALTTICSLTGCGISLQHAELTPKFKQYLEDKGLSEVDMFDVLVPVLFGVLCKA